MQNSSAARAVSSSDQAFAVIYRERQRSTVLVLPVTVATALLGAKVESQESVANQRAESMGSLGGRLCGRLSKKGSFLGHPGSEVARVSLEGNAPQRPVGCRRG